MGFLAQHEARSSTGLASTAASVVRRGAPSTPLFPFFPFFPLEIRAVGFDLCISEASRTLVTKAVLDLGGSTSLTGRVLHVVLPPQVERAALLDPFLQKVYEGGRLRFSFKTNAMVPHAVSEQWVSLASHLSPITFAFEQFDRSLALAATNPKSGIYRDSPEVLEALVHHRRRLAIEEAEARVLALEHSLEVARRALTQLVSNG